MKIHAYLLCYNEEEIIKNVIDYYSSFCSMIYVMDNMSTDDSVKIAKEYDKVRIIPWENDGYINESLYVKMKSETYKMYSRKGGGYSEEVADWIISCDMDEILYHPNIVDVLKKYKSMNVTVPQITGFNVVGENDINPNESIISQYDFGTRIKAFDKRIVFDCNFDISYSVGCHPSGYGFEYMKRSYSYKSSNDYPLALLHYKHIGKRFYEAALKNAERLNPKNLYSDEFGNTKGMGAHYIAIKSGSIKKKKEEFSQKLFDIDRNILFDDYSSTSGEKGIGDVFFRLSNNDINQLRDLVFKICDYRNVDRNIMIGLLKILLKLRPGGVVIRKKLDFYLGDGDNKC